MKRKAEYEQDIDDKLSKKRYEAAALSFMMMPKEVRVIILSNLNILDVIAMCKHGSTFKQWCDDPVNGPWSTLVINHFGIEKYKLAKEVLGLDSYDRYIYMSLYAVLKLKRPQGEHLILDLTFVLTDRDNQEHRIRLLIWNDDPDGIMSYIEISESHGWTSFLPEVLEHCTKIYKIQKDTLKICVSTDDDQTDISNNEILFSRMLYEEDELFKKDLYLVYAILNDGFTLRVIDEKGRNVNISCSMCDNEAKYQCEITGEYFCSNKCAK